MGGTPCQPACRSSSGMVVLIINFKLCRYCMPISFKLVDMSVENAWLVRRDHIELIGVDVTAVEKQEHSHKMKRAPSDIGCLYAKSVCLWLGSPVANRVMSSPVLEQGRQPQMQSDPTLWFRFGYGNQPTRIRFYNYVTFYPKHLTMQGRLQFFMHALWDFSP